VLIYNVVGQVVATLIDAEQGPGVRTVEWDATSFPSGVYFYRMTAGSFTQTRRMILIR